MADEDEPGADGDEPGNDPRKLVLAIIFCLMLCAGGAVLIQRLAG